MFRPGKNFRKGTSSNENSAVKASLARSLSNLEKGSVANVSQQIETAEINNISNTLSNFPPISASPTFRENLRQELSAKLGLL